MRDRQRISKNEYYRGFYDACVVFNQRVGVAGAEAQLACGEAVTKVHENEWFEQPSEGYLPPVEAEAH